jgi:hypothetical protein
MPGCRAKRQRIAPCPPRAGSVWPGGLATREHHRRPAEPRAVGRLLVALVHLARAAARERADQAEHDQREYQPEL